MMDAKLAKLFRESDLQGIPPFDKPFQFYFDETNNIGNFQLKTDKPSLVNDERALTSDFVLGGICFQSTPETDSLMQELHLKTNTPELKSNSLFKSKSKNPAEAFLDDIGQRRVTALIDWLMRHDEVYIHFALENNLFYAIIDIVDSLQGSDSFGWEYNLLLKDALYRMCKQNIKLLLPVLVKHKYPNIRRGFTVRFCKDMLRAIESASAPNDLYCSCILKMLWTHTESSDLGLLHDNDPLMLSGVYWIQYEQRCSDFLHSRLTFDRCNTVQNEFRKHSNCLSNYIFVDSKSSIYIQISDCVVALYARLFRFIDEFEPSLLNQLFGEECSEEYDKYQDVLARNMLREEKGLPPLQMPIEPTPIKEALQRRKNISALCKLMARSISLSPILVKKTDPVSVSYHREEQLKKIAMLTTVFDRRNA